MSEETVEEATARYYRAAHAMQSGVAMKMNYDQDESNPKHLRVGVNSALSNIGGLVTLLIVKGIFTEEEYATAVADSMEREKDSYELWLNERYGRENVVKLK